MALRSLGDDMPLSSVESPHVCHSDTHVCVTHSHRHRPTHLTQPLTQSGACGQTQGPQCTLGARPRSCLSGVPRLGMVTPNCPPLLSSLGWESTRSLSHPLQQHIVCPKPVSGEHETGRWSRREQPPTFWSPGLWVSRPEPTPLLRAGPEGQSRASRPWELLQSPPEPPPARDGEAKLHPRALTASATGFSFASPSPNPAGNPKAR